MSVLSIGLTTILALFPLVVSDPDTGSIIGRVMDEKLVGVPAATVSARNVFSGDVTYVQSDAAGVYKIVDLRPGRYSVFARAEGHGCKWVLNVPVFRGGHTQLDLVITKSRKGSPSEGCESTT
jgi:hypothetical protein